MHLDVITSDRFFKGEITLLHHLFEEGLRSLHIRKPGASLPVMRRFIQQIHPDYRPYLIIHEHRTLKEELGLGGLHVKPAVFRQLAADYGLLSTSVHDEASFLSLDRVHCKIFISPLYDSISKPGYLANQALGSVAGMPRKGKLIALGGINAENLPAVQEKGFDGAALLGYIWNHPKPVERFKKILHLINA